MDTLTQTAEVNPNEKERDPTQSYDESPYTNRKFNNQLTTQNFDYTTIVDRLAIQLVWLNRLTGTQPSH